MTEDEFTDEYFADHPTAAEHLRTCIDTQQATDELFLLLDAKARPNIRWWTRHLPKDRVRPPWVIGQSQIEYIRTQRLKGALKHG